MTDRLEEIERFLDLATWPTALTNDNARWLIAEVKRLRRLVERDQRTEAVGSQQRPTD